MGGLPGQTIGLRKSAVSQVGCGRHLACLVRLGFESGDEQRASHTIISPDVAHLLPATKPARLHHRFGWYDYQSEFSNNVSWLWGGLEILQLSSKITSYSSAMIAT